MAIALSQVAAGTRKSGSSAFTGTGTTKGAVPAGTGDGVAAAQGSSSSHAMGTSCSSYLSSAALSTAGMPSSSSLPLASMSSAESSPPCAELLSLSASTPSAPGYLSVARPTESSSWSPVYATHTALNRSIGFMDDTRSTRSLTLSVPSTSAPKLPSRCRLRCSRQPVRSRTSCSPGMGKCSWHFSMSTMLINTARLTRWSCC
mmetsp:Transcript_9462/g.27000  ORF Transcript_9462/g.27000 Transcript_9462/m.27000 type:complete len:203 (+) Transcript_9462:1315-1923(+)